MASGVFEQFRSVLRSECFGLRRVGHINGKYDAGLFFNIDSK